MADTSHRRAGLIFIGACVAIGVGVFAVDQGKDLMSGLATPRATPSAEARAEPVTDFYRPVPEYAPSPAPAEPVASADADRPADADASAPTDTASPPVGDAADYDTAPGDDAHFARLRRDAAELTRSFFSVGGAGEDEALAWLSSHYASQVMFFGKTTDRPAILREKVAYIRRWPSRSYTIEPDSVTISCGDEKPLCRTSGIVDYSATSDERGASAEGKASFDLVTLSTPQGPLIVGETSKVIERQ